MTQMDYTDKVTSQDFISYEWEGNLVLFSQTGMAILTIPATLEAPKGMSLAYQSTGSLNKTYSWAGTKIVYVMPLKNGISRLAIVYSRVLLGEQVNKKSQETARLLQAKRRITQHLFINEVEVGSPVLQFDKFDDETLLAAGQVYMDVFYNVYPDYKHIRYNIKFIHKNSFQSLWLWVSLGIIVIIFISILTLCIRKSNKAFRKVSLVPEGAETNFQEPSSQKNHEEPLLITKIPNRLQNQQ